MMTVRDNYNAPFTLTRGNTVYVPKAQIPFKLGSLELGQVISNRINELDRELQHWQQLSHSNDSALELNMEHEQDDNN